MIKDNKGLFHLELALRGNYSVSILHLVFATTILNITKLDKQFHRCTVCVASSAA